MITRSLFDYYNGRKVYLYTLANDILKVGIIDFGAAIQFIKLNSPHGEIDVTLGFNCISEYINSGMYCGATIGRVSNRIKKAEFLLNGQKIKLSKNEGENHLHGGAYGFDKKFFIVQEDADKLVFMYYSKHNDQGYPGNLTFQVEFCLHGSNLKIIYVAKSDRDTIWSPTCHTYFNLNGKGNIKDTLLRINAEKYTPVDDSLTPTGELLPVKDTPFDFTFLKPIGNDIETDCVQLKIAGGYDHNFILKGNYAATAKGDNSGITLELYTDMPGLQFYSGNYIKGNGKNGELCPREGFCLEPQFFPNAVNISSFQKPLLKANTQKRYFIEYQFCYT